MSYIEHSVPDSIQSSEVDVMDEYRTYDVSMFFLLKDEESAPLPFADFDNFKDAMSFYLEKVVDLRKDAEKKEPEIWFLTLASTNHKKVISEGVEIEETCFTKIMKHEGNI